MAEVDVRESFPTLEDASTKAGLALTKVTSGDTPTGLNGLMALAFRDSAGNLILPQLNADGALPVTSDTVGQTALSSFVSAAGTTSYQTLATVALTHGRRYDMLNASGSCFRDAVFELVHIDDSAVTPVETIIGKRRTNGASPNWSFVGGPTSFVAGSTGTCVLIVRGKLLAASPQTDLDASVATLEHA